MQKCQLIGCKIVGIQLKHVQSQRIKKENSSSIKWNRILCFPGPILFGNGAESNLAFILLGSKIRVDEKVNQYIIPTLAFNNCLTHFLSPYFKFFFHLPKESVFLTVHPFRSQFISMNWLFLKILNSSTVWNPFWGFTYFSRFLLTPNPKNGEM